MSTEYWDPAGVEALRGKIDPTLELSIRQPQQRSADRYAKAIASNNDGYLQIARRDHTSKSTYWRLLELLNQG